MTKAERLAAKIQRDRETLEKQRQVLADSEATLRAEIRHSEAALREEERKATDKRRYQVGALAEEAGLFVMSNTELAEVFAALGALRAGERPGAVLKRLWAILGGFRRGLRMGREDTRGWRQGEKKTRKKVWRDRGFSARNPPQGTIWHGREGGGTSPLQADRVPQWRRGGHQAARVHGWLGALEQRTGLREIIPQLVHRICRISKGSELSAHHGLRQAEGVATEQIDMAPPQRS